MPKLLISYSKNSLINILFYKKTTKSRCFLTYIFLFSTFVACFAQFFFENLNYSLLFSTFVVCFAQFFFENLNYSLLFSMKKSNAFIISSKSSFGLSASSRSNPLSLSGLFGFFLIMFLAKTLFSSVSSLFK